MTKYRSALVTASLTTLTAFALAPVVRADIFQWEYINPADPSQGKQPSTTLCPEGAGAYAGPGANLANRNLTIAYLIGAELSADVVTDFEGNVISYTVADLSGANLSEADAQGAHFYFAKLTGANLSGANLKNVHFWGYPYWAIPTGADLTNANLSGADARGADFGVAILAGANFTDAEVRGASFVFSQITKTQLYSTASYQAHDLSGIKLSGNYAGLDLAGQILTNATFYIATLSGANLSQANLTNADFSSYTTGIADLTGANLSHANLTNVDFGGYEGEDGILPGANLTDANLSGADARGAIFDFATLSGANTSNLIQSNGHVSGLDLTAGASLVVRDYDGNPATAPPAGPIPIVVDQHLAMDATSMLQLVFEADPWGSTIAFTPGIPVARGGTLELTFAPDVNLDSQLGRTIDLFDWTGVIPTGAFNVASSYTWDLSKLYTTGEVTLTTAAMLSGDFSGDSVIDGADLASWKAGFGSSGNATHSQGDADGDLDVDGADFLTWQRQLGGAALSASPAAVPEPSAGILLLMGYAAARVFARSRLQRRTVLVSFKLSRSARRQTNLSGLF